VEVDVADVADAKELLTVHVMSRRAAYRGILPDDYLDALTVDGWLEWWERLIRATDLPRTGTLKLVDGDAIVGYVTFGPSEDAGAIELAGEVRMVHLLPIVWRRGGGSALTCAACGSLRAAGFRTATLWVMEGNQRARLFYEAKGWTPDGGRKEDESIGIRRVQLRYRILL
jgi:ribosomal protein S18 acetylase RimI-like enzyme